MKRTARKEWTGAESRLVSEFLAARYPDKRTMQRVRVGRIPSELPITGLSPAEVRMLGVWRRWVDALVFNDGEIILIEAAVRPDPGDVSQLDLYMKLFPMTPEFLNIPYTTVRGMLVYAIPDPVIETLAAERGYTVQIYHPPWVDDYFNELAARMKRAPLAQT